jgi:hypothetical protein
MLDYDVDAKPVQRAHARRVRSFAETVGVAPDTFLKASTLSITTLISWLIMAWIVLTLGLLYNDMYDIERKRYLEALPYDARCQNTTKRNEFDTCPDVRHVLDSWTWKLALWRMCEHVGVRVARYVRSWQPGEDYKVLWWHVVLIVSNNLTTLAIILVLACVLLSQVAQYVRSAWSALREEYNENTHWKDKGTKIAIGPDADADTPRKR